MGQKQKTEKRKRRGLNDGNNNGQLRIATPPRVAHAKTPGPKKTCIAKRECQGKYRVLNLSNIHIKHLAYLKCIHIVSGFI